MASGSAELFELFVALAGPRIEAARTALGSESAQQRGTELRAALVPLAVDAALLGADGISALARAAAAAPGAEPEQLGRALDALEQAAQALGGPADVSGARVDESALMQLAETFAPQAEPAAPEQSPEPAAALTPPAEQPPPAPVAAPSQLQADDPQEVHWEPQLPEDMLAAFLDECVERLDGLAERLLVLEEQGSNPELVGEIFRDLHTLKGSSAFAGLKRMNRVAHRAEDLIGELRDGKRQCDRALVDLLLEALDTLRAILDRARARAPIDVEVADLVRRLGDPAALPAQPVAALAPKAVASQPRPTVQQSATLRIDFAKVDQLLNLVGEIVLARGRLTSASEAQSTLVRELSGLRKKLAAQLDRSNGGGPARALAELTQQLQRTERILYETDGDLDSALGALGLAVGQLRDHVMKLRMVPISRLFAKYQRTVRELSHQLGKQVDVKLVGADTELDKVLVERLEDPLLHLVRNSVDHGLETPPARQAAGKPSRGTVRMTAAQRGGQIIVTIEDDGKGLDSAKLRQTAVARGLLEPAEAEALSDEESYQLIFAPGFSTADRVSDISGRGVGMDVVRDVISKLKGSIHIDSRPGSGTTITLRLPLTLAITQVLVARVGTERVAIPLEAVISAQSLDGRSLEKVGDGVCLRVAERLVPVADLAELLGLRPAQQPGGGDEAAVVITQAGPDQLGLLVQQVLGRHEVVIKSLGPLLEATPAAAGATLLGNRVLLVLDVMAVAALARTPGPAGGIKEATR